MIIKKDFKKFIYQAIISYILVLITSLICLNIFELEEKNCFIISIIISFFYNFLFTVKITFNARLNLKNFINYIIFTLFFRTIEYFIFIIVRDNSNNNYFLIVTFVLIISFLMKFITLRTIYKKN
jgi:hypothetical protein